MFVSGRPSCSWTALQAAWSCLFQQGLRLYFAMGRRCRYVRDTLGGTGHA